MASCRLAVNKRDASRYGLRGTGTTVRRRRPTAQRCSVTSPRFDHGDLVRPRRADGAILVWFVAGGDCARAGDPRLAGPGVAQRGRVGPRHGRLPGATLTETSWMSSASPTSAAPASGSTRTVTRLRRDPHDCSGLGKKRAGPPWGPAYSSGFSSIVQDLCCRLWSGGEWLGQLGSNQHLPG